MYALWDLNEVLYSTVYVYTPLHMYLSRELSVTHTDANVLFHGTEMHVDIGKWLTNDQPHFNGWYHQLHYLLPGLHTHLHNNVQIRYHLY